MEYVELKNTRLGMKRTPGKQAKTEGPCLVFLHEGLGCIEMWKDFPDTLCAETGLPGVVYERKGYGRDAPDEGNWALDYLDTESREYLPALLEVLEIHQAVLIGHSDGGTIALLGAGYAPSRVLGVITEAAHVFVESVTISGIRDAVYAYENKNLKKALYRYHGNNTDRVFYRWANRWLSPEFSGWNIENRLSAIKCPLLILQGEKDEYATLKQVEAIEKGVSGPRESVVIPGCGHVPHKESPERVCTIIADYIQSMVSFS